MTMMNELCVTKIERNTIFNTFSFTSYFLITEEKIAEILKHLSNNLYYCFKNQHFWLIYEEN